jgi:hypothetical protein
MKILLFIFFFPFLVGASEGDIDWIGEKEPVTISSILEPDHKGFKTLRSDSIGVAFYIEKNNELSLIHSVHVKSKNEKISIPANSLGHSIQFCRKNPKSSFSAVLELKTAWFNIGQRETYQVPIQLECGKMSSFIFNHDSMAGQAMGIFDVALTAVKKLKDLNILNFWNKKINITFPSRGDYYSWGEVNISKGHYWDVVGHELGHAIYDLSNVGVMEGGRHRIDQCYTKALALSEGWASFFSAWLKVKLNDPNAKFEYMVPRRSPLEFENIPSDVCPSENNEWRVTGFLWDLIDINEDLQDTSKIPFDIFWNLTTNKGFKSTSELARFLLKNNFDPLLLNIVWKQNFLRDLR